MYVCMYGYIGFAYSFVAPVAISKCLVIDLSSSALAELSSSSLALGDGVCECVCVVYQ